MSGQGCLEIFEFAFNLAPQFGKTSLCDISRKQCHTLVHTQTVEPMTQRVPGLCLQKNKTMWPDVAFGSGVHSDSALTPTIRAVNRYVHTQS